MSKHDESCFLCGEALGIYSYKNTYFCKSCVDDLNAIVNSQIIHDNNEVEHYVIELIIFLTFDLKLTRRNLNATRNNVEINVVNNKLASLDVVDITNFEVSDMLKEKVDELLSQHKLLLSLY